MNSALTLFTDNSELTLEYRMEIVSIMNDFIVKTFLENLYYCRENLLITSMKDIDSTNYEIISSENIKLNFTDAIVFVG